MLRYFTLLLVFLVAGVSGVAAVLHHKYYVARDLHADERLGALARWQDGKIEDGTAARAQVVFVGDSALGNALDAELFAENTGKSAVNLALTGSFHYSAAYSQLRRIAASPNSVETVVLMYSVDAPAETFSADGHFFASPLPFVPGLPLHRNAQLVATAFERLVDTQGAFAYMWRRLVGGPIPSLDDLLLQYDYVVSSAQIALIDNGYRVPNAVGNASEGFLPLIVALCREQGWRCVYAHGPLLDYALELTGADRSAYFAEASRQIRGVGLEMTTTEPVLMRPHERGDTFFHVHSDFRDEYTALYADVLAPYFRDDGVGDHDAHSSK